MSCEATCRCLGTAHPIGSSRIFYDLSGTSARPLGFFIAHGVVRAHGGGIGIEKASLARARVPGLTISADPWGVSYRSTPMSELLLARPRLTAWTVSDDHNQYGRFYDPLDAQLEAASRRALGASSVKIFEVWLNPDERVVGTAVCERCERRLPHFDGRVVSSSASIICGPCSEEKYGVWSEEPTVVSCWPVEHGYVDDEGEYQLYHEIPTQERRAIDFRFKDTLIEAVGRPIPSALAIRGDLGAVRLLLSTDRALDIGVRLQEALVGGWSAEFKTWVRWGLPEPQRQPPKWEPLEAHFESNEEAVTIKSGTRDRRVALEIESAKTLIAMTMEPAVAFKVWRALCPTSG